MRVAAAAVLAWLVASGAWAGCIALLQATATVLDADTLVVADMRVRLLGKIISCICGRGGLVFV